MSSQSVNALLIENFRLVAERVKDRRDSLLSVTRFRRLGIEGWFKVEAVRALGNRMKRLHNHGPDLELVDELFIELKAGTDFNPSWISEALKYASTHQRFGCLFLYSGNISTCVEQLKHWTMLDHEKFSVETDEWIIGLIVPEGERPA
jgi:hypothetical protein